jgi:type III restriction enzyme
LIYNRPAISDHAYHTGLSLTSGLIERSLSTLVDEVIRYVKNQNLGFAIPYTLGGEEKNYIPDFVVCMDDGHGQDDLLNLILEVTGEKRKDKAAKVATARTLWIPAVNNHDGFGRWAFLEVADPWDTQNLIRSYLKQLRTKSVKEPVHG